MYLCLGNTKDSQVVLYYILEQKNKAEEDGGGETSPFDTPLVNFVTFLFSAIQRNDPNLFRALISKYAPSISRDPEFHTYLDRIGQVFFGLSSNQSGGFPGFLGEFMKSFLSGDSPTTTPTTTTTAMRTISNEDVD